MCDLRRGFWEIALSAPRESILSYTRVYRIRAQQLVPENYDPKYYELSG